MNQRSLFRLLLRPSLMSGSLVVLGALGVLGYTAWLYLNNNQILYSSLFGSYGLQSFIEQNSGSFMSWQRVLLASPVAYYVLVSGVAVAAGMAVFTVLQVLGLVFRSTTLFMHEAIHGRRERIAFWAEQFAKLLMRVLSLLGGTVYAAAFISMILPFCILLDQTGVEGLHQNNMVGGVMCAAALVLLIFAMHLLIVFLRAIALRPRLFGGDAEIAAAEAH